MVSRARVQPHGKRVGPQLRPPFRGLIVCGSGNRCAARRRWRCFRARRATACAVSAASAVHRCVVKHTKRNDAQRAPSARPRNSIPFRECAQRPWVLIVKSGDFSVRFDEGDGLKNRCRFARKSWIRQVPISRTLSVCGEVAEWPKAAVC